MACSSSSATAESLQDTLATALHANLSDAEETVLVTPAHKDLGAYGSDLQVQVLPLSNAPMTLEIDFRYGVECGDDNLLLIYRRNTTAAGEWKEVLRWDAPAYRNVGDAFGDFVLLTPLAGLPNSPNWRAAVAHGHPGCSTTDRSSRFDLDLSATNCRSGAPGSGLASGAAVPARRHPAAGDDRGQPKLRDGTA